MPKVYLFHHALGRTAGVTELVDRLAALGHDVEAPDLFGGRTFTDLDSGVAHADEVGFGAIADRGVAAAVDSRFAVIGISLGALPAQKLAQTDDRVAGAALISSAIPLGVFGETWPEGLPLEMHLVEHDPWAEEDLPAATALEGASGGTLHLYPGRGHLVLEAGHPDFDEATASAIIGRLDTFLRSLDD